MHHKAIIIFSFFLVPILFGIFFMDLGGIFNYSDLPFFIVFLLYFLFLFLQKGRSVISFSIVLFLLIYMGLSYIPTGGGKITERIGEWFFLFLFIGVLQQGVEGIKYRRRT